jgi:hypothetical protein
MLNNELLDKFLEKAARPGLLGLPGRVLELRAIKDMRAYFKALCQDIRRLKLEELATKEQDVGMTKHQVEVKLHRVLRLHGTVLEALLKEHLTKAYELATKLDYLKEAEGDGPPIDRLGSSGQSAADWAADQAAQLVKGINQTTLDQIAGAVAEGIQDQLGVPGTSRLIRLAVDNMSKVRSDMIATTEMNRAMSTAALDKMGRLGVEYKQIILAPDACDICQENADADPIEVDEDYPSGDDGPPFHPNCRCAVTGARPPSDEEGD